MPVFVCIILFGFLAKATSEVASIVLLPQTEGATHAALGRGIEVQVHSEGLRAELEEALQSSLGRSESEARVEIYDEILSLFEMYGYPAVQLYDESDDPSRLVLRYQIAHIEQCHVETSLPALADFDFGLSGRPVFSPEMNRVKSWLSLHPARTVRMGVFPSSDFDQIKLSYTLAQPREWQHSASVDSHIAELLGDLRLAYQLQYLPRDGRYFDYLLSGQLFTTNRVGRVLGTSLSVQSFWHRHKIRWLLEAAYVQSNLSYRQNGTLEVDTKGQSFRFEASGNWMMPLGDKNVHELDFGFQFLRQDQFIEANRVIQDTTPADFVECFIGYRISRARKWDLSWRSYFSPGGVTSYNNDESFASFINTSEIEAAYWRHELKGNLSYALSEEVKMTHRLKAQYASEILLPAKRASIGGSEGFGYSANSYFAEKAVTLNSEASLNPRRIPKTKSWYFSPRLTHFIGSGSKISPEKSAFFHSLGVGCAFQYQSRSGNMAAQCRIDYAHPFEKDHPTENWIFSVQWQF